MPIPTSGGGDWGVGEMLSAPLIPERLQSEPQSYSPSTTLSRISSPVWKEATLPHS